MNPVLLHARAHHERRADELGPRAGELRRDERAHRQADQEHRRRADGLDQRGAVARVLGDRPRRRAVGRRRADAARVVGRVAEAGLERGRLEAPPVRAGMVAGGEPDDVGAGAGLLVEQRGAVDGEGRHASAAPRLLLPLDRAADRLRLGAARRAGPRARRRAPRAARRRPGRGRRGRRRARRGRRPRRRGRRRTRRASSCAP